MFYKTWCIFLPFLIYISSQNFFNCPFVENNFDNVFGANQKINVDTKRKIAPAVIPTVPSEEKVWNRVIMLYLIRVGKMNPKIRTNKYRAVNILYILKTAFIAYLILCSKLLHRNWLFLNSDLILTLFILLIFQHHKKLHHALFFQGISQDQNIL